jgi:hypothetical protein
MTGDKPKWLALSLEGDFLYSLMLEKLQPENPGKELQKCRKIPASNCRYSRKIPASNRMDAISSLHFLKNLLASLFYKFLSNEPNFSWIHPTGQYL